MRAASGRRDTARQVDFLLGTLVVVDAGTAGPATSARGSPGCDGGAARGTAGGPGMEGNALTSQPSMIVALSATKGA